MGCCRVGEVGIQTGKIDNLIGWLLLTIAGVSLALSFFVAESFAWVPLIVCGMPLVKMSIESLAVERRIRSALLISCAMAACVAIGQLFAAGEVAFIMALGEKLEDSSVQRLVRLVKEAERKKAPMQRIADKWAAILVPIALGVALLTCFGVYWWCGDLHTALVRGVTIMVVFCPCALALATPTSVMAAIGQATKNGVIIKSGEALEKMGEVTFACFDKTGTLCENANGVFKLRKEARSTVSSLAELGVRSLMLSGDKAEIARRFAVGAGIAEYRAECLPEDKSRYVESLRKRGEKVMMVGDGINDAIALKVADVGVAMGAMGTDIAQEAADVSLVKDDLSKLVYLKRLSTACMKLIKINITISMTINAVAIICSILGVLGPVSGALVHNLGSVLVVLNGALLYDRKL